MPRRTDLIRPLPDEPGPKPKWSEENADMATAPQRNPREVVDFPGCLSVLGDTARRSVSRGANPGTDSQFPANYAGNLVSVPGLRRIAGRLPQNG